MDPHPVIHVIARLKLEKERSVMASLFLGNMIVNVMCLIGCLYLTHLGVKMTWFKSSDIIPTDKQPIMIEINERIHIAYWSEGDGRYVVGCGEIYNSNIYFKLKTPHGCLVTRWKPFFVNWELEDDEIYFCDYCDKKHEECVQDEISQMKAEIQNINNEIVRIDNK